MNYLINQNNYPLFLQQLQEGGTVIAPLNEFNQYHLQELAPTNQDKIDLTGYRTVESFKSYFFRTIEQVSSYFGTDEPTHSQKLTLLGVRACDLEALEILDRVFGEGELKDPFYLSNRKDTFIISTDCTDCAATCFCNLVNGRPYPTKLFDLNLSPLASGYGVEIGSPKGQQFIDDNLSLFEKDNPDVLSQKESLRNKVAAKLTESNRAFHSKANLSEIHKVNLENKAWKSITKNCVECGNCNFICPTCSCFLLLDDRKQPTADGNDRYKVWDACLKNGYAKVAGGSNSRGKLTDRLQNRYHCKFDYSFDRLGRYTCVGCGRCCVDGCMAKIDMRQVFMELIKQVLLTAKME
ncbi:MAG: 4Fe-4S dicluster domain-containing protein [Candidatus Margulisiibacteriota bacterium]